MHIKGKGTIRNHGSWFWRQKVFSTCVAGLHAHSNVALRLRAAGRSSSNVWTVFAGRLEHKCFGFCCSQIKKGVFQKIKPNFVYTGLPVGGPRYFVAPASPNSTSQPVSQANTSSTQSPLLGMTLHFCTPASSPFRSSDMWSLAPLPRLPLGTLLL